MAAPEDVEDRPSEHRFVLEVDGHLAELVYRREPERLVLIHTGVPEELGGHGLGGVLVRHAVDVAAAEGLTIRPECPYARAWLEKHPDAAAAVTIEWPKG
jgi:predicted GNAT family acetyltransferase